MISEHAALTENRTGKVPNLLEDLDILLDNVAQSLCAFTCSHTQLLIRCQACVDTSLILCTAGVHHEGVGQGCIRRRLLFVKQPFELSIAIASRTVEIILGDRGSFKREEISARKGIMTPLRSIHRYEMMNWSTYAMTQITMTKQERPKKR